MFLCALRVWLLTQRPAATISAMYTPYFIHAEWDAEAAVWVATSNDVPGLVTEAETLEALAAKLRVMVPELLALNGANAVLRQAGLRKRF